MIEKSEVDLIQSTVVIDSMELKLHGEDLSHFVKKKLAQNLADELLKGSATLFTFCDNPHSYDRTYIARCALLKKEAVKRLFTMMK